ncbi:MAG: hypothetical protein AAF298_16820, partial [Cyanobacteria bacterium P01_A01_bin.40]
MSLLNSGGLVPERKSGQNKANLSVLIASIHQELLPNLKINSIDHNHPVVVEQVLAPWQLLGTGNYAGVFFHSDYADLVVKVYAPGRSGWSEELEVYQRLGSHAAYSTCWYRSGAVLCADIRCVIALPIKACLVSRSHHRSRPLQHGRENNSSERRPVRGQSGCRRGNPAQQTQAWWGTGRAHAALVSP